MTSYVAAEIRRLVESRANGLCEYCFIHEDDTYLGCQVDHVIAEKHGGLTEPDNLCYACAFCNRSKGTDIGSVTTNGEFTRFYNPRVDRWLEHFQWNGIRIETLTAIGEVTSKILRFNDPERFSERESLEESGRYPSSEATQFIEDIDREER